MKLSPLLLAALVCSTCAHGETASASSEKLSKKSSRSDQQRLTALKMDTAGKAKDSLEGNDVAENNIPFTGAPEPEENSIAEPSSSSSLEREPVEAQVILSNVNIQDLTAEETMFFESTLRKAIQLAQDQEQGSSEDEVTIGAIVVENGHGLHQQDDNNNNRALRRRELPSFKFFNIWAIIETYSCRFCYAYDDDDTDHYEEWKKARPTPAPTPAPTPKPTFEEGKDIYGWWRNQMKTAFGGGRRHLGVSESNASFLEDILCQLLREGPHERFWSVDKCALGVSKW